VKVYWSEDTSWEIEFGRAVLVLPSAGHLAVTLRVVPESGLLKMREIPVTKPSLSLISNPAVLLVFESVS